MSFYFCNFLNSIHMSILREFYELVFFYFCEISNLIKMRIQVRISREI